MICFLPWQARQFVKYVKADFSLNLFKTARTKTNVKLQNEYINALANVDLVAVSTKAKREKKRFLLHHLNASFGQVPYIQRGFF